MRRDVRRHTYGDTGRSVHQQVRESGRQYHRFFFVLVKVRLEIDRVFIYIRYHLQGYLRKPCLGVTHRGRRVVIAGSEVSVSVDEHRPHREILR